MRGVDPLAVWYLVIFGLLIPFVVIRGRNRGRAGIGIPPLNKQATQIVIMELLFLFVALFAARNREMQLFARGTLPLKAIVLGAVVLVAGLGTLPWRWRFLSDVQKLKSLATRPQKPGDLAPWFIISLAAGIVEEIVYRGVMMGFVLPMTRNWWLAVAICVLLFCLGHLNQPVLTVALVLGPLTLALHFLVAWTGSLFLAMAAHFLYDFSAGFLFIRIARKHRASISIAPESHLAPVSPVATK